jgi:hypothetical protein
MAADPRSLPKTVDGVREAWSVVEAAWAGTAAVARELDPPLVHVAVDGEWSFVETQRHLLFVTDAWVGRTVLDRATPYHRLGLPPDHRIGEPDPAVDVSVWGIDVFAPASLDEVLEARGDRMRTVRDVLDGLAPDGLQRMCDANPAPGFPPSTVMPVGFCLDIVIGEEWAHHAYAVRDLATLVD